jgi:hypothetical protein
VQTTTVCAVHWYLIRPASGFIRGAGAVADKKDGGKLLIYKGFQGIFDFSNISLKTWTPSSS